MPKSNKKKLNENKLPYEFVFVDNFITAQLGILRCMFLVW